MRHNRALALLTIVLTAVLVGCGGSAPPAQQPGADPGEQQSYESGAIVSEQTVSGSDPAVPEGAESVRRITYMSRSAVDDSTTQVTGSVYLPAGPPPQGGRHVVAYGQAVSGSTPECALSPEAKARSSAAVGALLKAGYVVAVPDYQGLGNLPEEQRLYHPSQDSGTAGYNLIDAVRAAKNLVADTSPIWVAVGDAQDGQAAWALNELADNYGFQSLRGTVSIAPTADLTGLADAAAGGTLTPEQQHLYMSYLSALSSEYPGRFRIDDYRRGSAKQNWDLLLGCAYGDDAARATARAQIKPDDLRPATPEALAALHTYLQKTTLPQGPAQQPMLVIFGDQDPLTPPAWTQRALSRACAMNDQITIRQQAAPTLDTAALAWIATALREQPVADDCASFLAAHPAPPTSQAAGRRAVSPVTTTPADAAVSAGNAPQALEVSLINGWLPVTIQVLTACALIAAVGWRSRQWWRRGLPIAAAAGVALIAALWWFVHSEGLGSVYPWGMWVWTGLTGLAAVVLVLGWRGSTWWRRAVSVLAVPLSVVSAATVLNVSLGYLPTVSTAWQRATGQLPPQWIDRTELAAMRRDGVRPTRGTVVRITTPGDVSGFSHREELVYLPPAWFASNPPPRLPAVMMIGAELSAPSDWLQAGHALTILDDFALAHRGVTPVVVFPDTSGSFTNDTECVNGVRGAAADHLIKEVVPYMISSFGVSDDATNWGLAGWSSGGTCSLMLAALHPEMFSAFVDLDGQLGPNAGTKRQTIARLFGGDADAWAAFDPRTVVEARGHYDDMAAWVGVSDEVPAVHRAAGAGSAQSDSLNDWNTFSEDHGKTADQLCELLSAYGVECSVVGYAGGHDFPSAANGFRAALPWLAGRLDTPGVPPIPLPGA